MENDKKIKKKKCTSVIIKKHWEEISEDFFNMASDPECNRNVYEENYHANMETFLKEIFLLYSSHGNRYTFDISNDNLDDRSDSEYTLRKYQLLLYFYTA